MILKENMKWYHGSYAIVSKPKLSLCMPGKDFGTGFYVTTDEMQARRFVKSSIGKVVLCQDLVQIKMRGSAS